MASVKISQNEINKLLNMLKNSLIHLINFPGKGATKEFQNVHINPNGEKITGNHWHVCDEAYGLKWAYPADDLESEQFVENTVAFLSKFHVIKQPQVNFQLELNSI